MPSDASLVDRAVEALSDRIDAFHSAVAVADREVHGWLARRRGAEEFRAERALMELGPFAVHRIDPALFARLAGRLESADPGSVAVLDRADAELSRLEADRGLHFGSVELGGDLRDTVKAMLDRAGRAFGVARVVELARSNRFDPATHEGLMNGLPFRRWNREERRLAPPLVVEVAAEDLLPAGLGEFLDGLVKIVLVVRGNTAPAPLARLVTPSTYVVQTADPADLEAMADSPHPGVGLLFDEERPGQARFVHDPDAGTAPWSRLTVHHLPERPSVGRGRRAPTWLEELDHLESLTAAPVAVAAADDVAEPAGDAAVDPADRLAAWLLHQTPLDDQE